MEKSNLRSKMLAGIITESEYDKQMNILSEQAINKTTLSEQVEEKKMLSEDEQAIIDDILGSDADYSLNEAVSFSKTIEKVKSYAKKGMITATILASLMSSPAFSQVEKDEIGKVVDEYSQTDNVGGDLLSKFHKAMDAHKPKDGEFKRVSSDPHSSEFEKITPLEKQVDTTFSYENKDALNPNVDLEDASQNADSKVIQQKYNWIIKNMKSITPSSNPKFKGEFENLKKDFSNRFPDSKMDMKKIDGENTVIFDHVFKQNDGYAQGPQDYKTIDGKIIEVGDRIPEGSHVIDFYAGTVKGSENINIPTTKDTVNLVQLKMKPISVKLEGTKDQIQKTIKDFKDVFSKYGEIITTGSNIVLDPTYIGVVETKDASSEINSLNSDVKKLGDKYGFDFKGNVFSQADSVDGIK